MSKTIQVGMVGYGISAKIFQAPMISSVPDIRLSKVVERSGEKSKKDYPDVEIVRDLDQLLEDETIDLIVITTPNEYHYSMAEKALLAGKHVVVEKPFTNTSRDALKLIDLAKKQNKILSVYHNRRWDGDFQTVRKIVQEGLLGELAEAEIHYDRYRKELKPQAWREENKPGSGILYDLGAHLIDQAQYLFGLPHTITADVRIQREGGKIDDSFDILLSYGKLKVRLKAGMLVREPGPHFILHGTNGSFIKYGMDPQEAALKQGLTPRSENWGIEPKEHWGKLNTDVNGLHFEGQIETHHGDYTAFYQNIYDVIVNQQELIVKPEEAYNTIRIIELALKSSKEQRTVEFE